MGSGMGPLARPGVFMAAAALATATSAVCSTDRLHPLVPTLLPHTHLPLVSSATAIKAGGNLSGDFSKLTLTSSLPSIHKVVNSIPLMGSLRSLNQIVSNSSFPARLYPWCAPGAMSPLVHSVSPLRPSYLCSTLGSPKDEIHSRFKAYTAEAMPQSQFRDFSTSPLAMASSVNSPSFDTFDLSFHLASFFTSAAAPQASQTVPLKVSSQNFHKWHSPISEPPIQEDDAGKTPASKPVLTVVLLGWLGSQQKHLKKYAEWYNARGINAVTFTIPMADIINISVASKAEVHVEHLTSQLSAWLDEETQGAERGVERQLIFHTFSNTGWLTYGIVLEQLSLKGDLRDRIKGCVVDSAPAADLDPQVWASGFLAALLKKRNTAVGGMRDSGIADSRHTVLVENSKPRLGESACRAFLEKFFGVLLQIPVINSRLNQVISVLAKEQPQCPQLYIYSTADEVIPARMVESFMEQQRKQGRVVKGYNFESSPHVDHFRTFPEIYSSQISNFLEECLTKSFSKRP